MSRACQFPWCKFSHHGQFQTSSMTPLNKAQKKCWQLHNCTLLANTRWLQNIWFCLSVTQAWDHFWFPFLLTFWRRMLNLQWCAAGTVKTMLGVALMIFQLQLGPCLHLICDVPVVTFHPFGSKQWLVNMSAHQKHREVSETGNAWVPAPEILIQLIWVGSVKSSWFLVCNQGWEPLV